MAQQVTFRRIRGRIVPIKRKKTDDSNLKPVAGGVAAATGTGVALDAANTRRVYENKKTGIVINQKRFAPNPQRPWQVATTLKGYKKGQKFGNINYAPDGDTVRGGKQFAVNWLGVNENFRGKGLSKVLSAHAVSDMKRRGGKGLWSNVVHANSLKVGFDPKRDTLFREIVGSMKGDRMDFAEVDKKSALRSLRYFSTKLKLKTSNIWRDTNLVKVKVPKFKPYMTGGTKLRLGLGLGLAAAGSGYALATGKKD